MMGRVEYAKNKCIFAIMEDTDGSLNEIMK